MNGLYDLRYRDPKEGEEELPPDNTVNALLKILTEAQKTKEQGDTGQNALLKRVASPDLSFKNFETPVAEPVVAPIPSETAQVITPAETKPANALLNIPEVPKKPANSLLDYWAQPVIGKMPLDQFVQIAGSLGHAFGRGPTGIEEPMGVLGGDLARVGGAAYVERARREYEEPTNVLRRKYLEAQIAQAEKEKIPTTWQAFYKEHMDKINPETGKTYTVGETLRAFHAAEAIPKEPSYHYVVDDEGNVSAFAGGKLVSGSGKGATKTRSATGGHYEVNDKGEVSYYEQGKLVSGPGMGKTKTQPGAGQKLTMTDVKSAYSMDVGNIKNQMMIEMTPDEQVNLVGQPDVNILALLLSGKVGKSLSPEKKSLYIGKLQDVEKYYGDLTNQVLGRKGAKIPEKAAVTPPPAPEKEIQALPAGSKLKGKSKKTGNPVYQLPDGSLKEVVP